MFTPAARLIESHHPEKLWTLNAGDNGYKLCFHGSWPAYEVVVTDVGADRKRLPFARIPVVPPRESVRLPAAPPTSCGGPWLKISWREKPRGGPGRSRRVRYHVLDSSQGRAT